MAEQVYAAGVQSFGPETVQASCTCGWLGPERVFVRRAHEDVMEHLTSEGVHSGGGGD